MASGANNKTAMAAESNPVQETCLVLIQRVVARRAMKVVSHAKPSTAPVMATVWQKHQVKRVKCNNLDDWGRLWKERPTQRFVKHLILHDSNYDHSSRKAREETCKKNNSTLEVSLRLKSRYREALNLCTYNLMNTLNWFDDQVT